jgi:hypothetical protein
MGQQSFTMAKKALSNLYIATGYNGFMEWLKACKYVCWSLAAQQASVMVSPVEAEMREEHNENSSLGYGTHGYSHAQEDHSAWGLELYCVHHDAQRQVAK